MATTSDHLADDTTEPWPARAGQFEGGFAAPIGTEIAEGRLRMWWGDAAAPILELEPLPLEQVLIRSEEMAEQRRGSGATSCGVARGALTHRHHAGHAHVGGAGGEDHGKLADAEPDPGRGDPRPRAAAPAQRGDHQRVERTEQMNWEGSRAVPGKPPRCG